MITAKTVKELRDRTGAGMMDCKKALAESNGDIEGAIDYLRTKGLAAAAKRSGRIAAEGLVQTTITEDGKAASLVEINCETDFVARNESFQQFVNGVGTLVAEQNPADVDALNGLPLTLGDTTGTVKSVYDHLVATIRENLRIRRFVRMEAGEGVLAEYTHHGGKVGVLVHMLGAAGDTDAAEVGRELGMQITALKAQYVSPEEVSEDVIEREKAIHKAQAMESGKPENIAEKMVIGRMRKYFSQVCLLQQPYMRDDKISVEAYLAQKSKELGKELKVGSFECYRLAEGQTGDDQE